MIDTVKSIIDAINKDTSIQIIKANTTAAKPSLPFGVYNITSPYIKDIGSENVVYVETENELIEVRNEQYKIVISFNFLGETNETSIHLALRVRKWFLFFGQDFIQNQNIAVISVGNVEARTTFLVDSYEHKHGFDVQLRLTDELSRQVDYFNKIGELKI